MPEETYRAIYAGGFKELRARLYSMLGSWPLAEDIAQEAFLKLYLKPPLDTGKARAWLYRVATNLASNWHRQEKRRAEREERFPGNRLQEEPAEEAALRRIEAQKVQEVLQRLGLRDRTCLFLKFAGFRYAEIARIVGIDPATVGTVLARAQARFVREYQRLGR